MTAPWGTREPWGQPVPLPSGTGGSAGGRFPPSVPSRSFQGPPLPPPAPGAGAPQPLTHHGSPPGTPRRPGGMQRGWEEPPPSHPSPPHPQKLPVVAESLPPWLLPSLFSMEVFHGNPRWAGPRAGINTAESQSAFRQALSDGNNSVCRARAARGRPPRCRWGGSGTPSPPASPPPRRRPPGSGSWARPSARNLFLFGGRALSADQSRLGTARRGSHLRHGGRKIPNPQPWAPWGRPYPVHAAPRDAPNHTAGLRFRGAREHRPDVRTASGSSASWPCHRPPGRATGLLTVPPASSPCHRPPGRAGEQHGSQAGSVPRNWARPLGTALGAGVRNGRYFSRALKEKLESEG